MTNIMTTKAPATANGMNVYEFCEQVERKANKSNIVASKIINTTINGMDVNIFLTKTKKEVVVDMFYSKDGESISRVTGSIDKDEAVFDFMDFVDDNNFRICGPRYRKLHTDGERFKEYGISINKADNATVISVDGIFEVGFVSMGSYLTVKTNTADSITYSGVVTWDDWGSHLNISNVNCEFDE